jgi:ATP-dependent DNA ligase
VSANRLRFIRPLAPSASISPPKGKDWLHEPKWDGFRFQIIKDGSGVRFFSRNGAEYTERLPRMAEAFAELPVVSAILDGELVLIDDGGAAHFYQLMAQMRTSHPDESHLMYLVFDLIHQDGVDLRSLTLTERKRDLTRLCRNARNPFLKQVETFSDGEVLFDYCNRFGFEGVVSKQRTSGYTSGASRHWVKVKCPDWKRANAHRHRLFEGNKRPALTEEQKVLIRKRQELARVLERLGGPDLSPGMARELRKHMAILVAEIAELE